MSGTHEIHLTRSISSNIHLSLYFCGREDCLPGHSWGPVVRDHYLIHYVTEGSGTFQTGERTYALRAGDGFLICPGERTTYSADFKTPWRYVWAGFHGISAGEYLARGGLSAQNPVFRTPDPEGMQRCFEGMIRESQGGEAMDLRGMASLYTLLSLLIEHSAGAPRQGRYSPEHHLRRVLETIHIRYPHRITIGELAQLAGLNRQYFCALFRRVTGVPPQTYLLQYRMDRACELMKDTRLSIGDVARSVGYEDPLLFSRMFSRVKGMPPREFRKGLAGGG